MKNIYRSVAAVLAAVLVCVALGSTVMASAENQTVIVTSPFTAAIAQVRDSVVGVSNYQIVRYSNSNAFDDFFGWGNWYGYPFGNGYGYGNGNNGRGSVQEQEVESATGSGVVIAKGYVLTNYHVVEKASSLKITVAREDSAEPDQYAAVLVASDSNLDVAVLYSPDLPLEPVKLGDSDTLQVGDWAICIGNPLGVKFAGTVTAGIVSALNRSVSSSSYDKYGRRETITNSMIQVDAAINNGNSGGGMFSVTGELMGIPTLKYSGSAYSGAAIDGIGMCIPINAAKPLINDVLSGTIATPAVPAAGNADTGNAASGTDLSGRPRIGITMSSNLNGLSAAVRSGSLPNGVYVAEVEKNSPAEIAGMQVGDIIVDVNDNVITSTTQIQQIVAQYQAGDELSIKVYRVPGLPEVTDLNNIPAGEYLDLKVTLAVIDLVQQ